MLFKKKIRDIEKELYSLDKEDRRALIASTQPPTFKLLDSLEESIVGRLRYVKTYYSGTDC